MLTLHGKKLSTCCNVAENRLEQYLVVPWAQSSLISLLVNGHEVCAVAEHHGGLNEFRLFSNFHRLFAISIIKNIQSEDFWGEDLRKNEIKNKLHSLLMITRFLSV